MINQENANHNLEPNAVDCNLCTKLKRSMTEQKRKCPNQYLSEIKLSFCDNATAI